MNGQTLRGVAALTALATLAACGNTAKTESTSVFGLGRQAVTQIIAQRSAKPAPPADPAGMAAEALAVNPGPLIMAGLENMGSTQVLALVGDNAGMRTYMTKNEQALILRGGMLIGTRGLGNDLASVDAGPSLALLRAGRGGQVQRTLRYYSGDGHERPLPFTCTIGAGPKPGVMVEGCSGNGISFQNNYLMSGGAISVSRQWAGPALGYITIQTLRP